MFRATNEDCLVCLITKFIAEFFHSVKLLKEKFLYILLQGKKSMKNVLRILLNCKD